MSILLDLHPLIMDMFISNEIDQKWSWNCYFVNKIAKEKMQSRKEINKITECKFNALAFLFRQDFKILKLRFTM